MPLLPPAMHHDSVWLLPVISILNKGTVPRDFRLQVFSWINFPQAPEYLIRAVSNFFEKSQRYSQLKVHGIRIWIQKYFWKCWVLNLKSMLIRNPEPDFVNLLGSPGIDSQPGWPVRKSYIGRTGPLGYIGWRNGFIGIDSWFLGSLKVNKFGLWLIVSVSSPCRSPWRPGRWGTCRRWRSSISRLPISCASSRSSSLKVTKSQIRKFLGLFHNSKCANCSGLPCQSANRKSANLYGQSANRKPANFYKILHNPVSKQS